MNVVIWVVQAVLGLAFVFAGAGKVSQPREKLKDRMLWVEDYSGPQVKAIGAAEVLGGIGLVLPAWTGIAPVLTPIAATGLAIIMILASVLHVRRKELNTLPITAVLFVLSAFVAITRFGPYAF